MHPIVKPDGQLNDPYIWRREPLYKGMNGKYVERVYITPSETFIFKPLTNTDQYGTEVWVYEQILPYVPPVYPKMIARSSTSRPEYSWTLFEDLGQLEHTFHEEIAHALIVHIAAWHALPIDNFVQAPLRGPKPSAEAIRTELLQHEEQVRALLESLPIPRRLADRLFFNLRRESLPTSFVLSHGDLHLGNYALVNEQIKVLDWEHAHLNCRYWDLYHVIDLSHPLFPKTVTPMMRERLLDGYLLQVEQQSTYVHNHYFKQGYYLFSSMFSLWMLRLISNDIQKNNGTWPEEQLKEQLLETTMSFIQCAERL
ncbi:phosphotransferase [Paenibacillus prosopidis]|uniref:Phosphotransferase family enzyme n=1 Tax=Paenibacillus prosopidis TaxID=630520 RepID=A0A368VRF0_9BACL|nr:phosphotransferase [Paenibacillus prosopidis]RCW43432.1 phosphotransferase family enzyme [Paenibacillus prosopidis]